jgi:hypothetical protein
MRQLVSAERIRSIIAGAMTEKEAADILRRHRIRYEYSTAGGSFHIRIPCRSGAVRIVKTASRSAPLVVRPSAVTCYPFPVPRFSWDD